MASLAAVLATGVALCLGQGSAAFPPAGAGVDAATPAYSVMVPDGAVPVASQSDVDALPAGANAVLTADLPGLTISRPVTVFGDGHMARQVTLAADGARVSGLRTGYVVVKADDCVVDHCTVDADGMYAVRADGVQGLKALDNDVLGNEVKEDCGFYITSSAGPVISGNTVRGAYYCICVDACTDPQVLNNHIEHVAGFRQGNDCFITNTAGGVFSGNVVDFDPYHGAGSPQDHNAIGFDHVSDMLIENNTAGGHYYTLKIYNSRDCVIQGNTLYKGGVVLRTGFFDSGLIVRDNKISGDPDLGRSMGIKIHDGTADSLYEHNEIWDCEYAIEEFHYPAGNKYLEGAPSLPCSNITLKENYIHDISSSAFIIQDKGSCTEIGNVVEKHGTRDPFPTTMPAPTPAPAPGPTASPAPSMAPSPEPSAQPASGGQLFDYITAILRLIFR